MRRPLRRAMGWTLLALQVLVLLGLGTYLLRWRLFEAFGRAPVERLLDEALGGEVQLGQLDGSVATGLSVRGLSLRTGGLLRRIDALDLAVELDPLALLRGDLAGVARLRAHAAALHLDLGAPPASTEPPTTPRPPAEAPDLAALAALLPLGAVVEVDDLRVEGRPRELRGRARIELLPTTGGARRVRVRGPGLGLDATLAADGSIAVEVAVHDATGAARLFAPLPPLDGGDLVLHGELRFAPTFAASVDLRIDDLTVGGRPVRRCEVSARVTTMGLTNLALDVAGPGSSLRADGVSLDFDRVLPSLRGDCALAIRDLSPWRDTLPEAVRDLLPLQGSLRAHAEAGELYVDDGELRARGARLRLLAGSLRLDGAAQWSTPVRAELDVLDAEKLPLPAEFRLRPTGGSLALRVEPRDQAFAVAAELDLSVADREAGTTATVRGTVDALLGTDGSVRATPDLAATGTALGPFEDGLRVRAEAAWNGGVATVTGLDLVLEGAGTVRGRARVPTGDLATLLAGTEIDLGIAADAAQRARLEQAVGGALVGDLRLANGSLRLDDLRAFARGHAFDLAGEVRATAEGIALVGVRVRDDLGNSMALDGRAPMPGGDLEATLRGGELALAIEADRLLPWLPPGLATASAAAVRATANWRGSETEPLAVSVRVTAAGLASGARTFDGAVDLRVSGDQDATRLDSLQVRVGEITGQGSGRLGLGPVAWALSPQSTTAAPVEFAWSLPPTDVAMLPVELLGFAQWTGQLAVDLALAGSLSEPAPRATVTLSDGGMLTTSGQRLDDLEVQLEVVPDAVRIVRFAATRGAGPLHVAGAFTAPGHLWERWRDGQVDLAITGADVLLHRRAGVKVRTDLDVKVKGPLREMVVDGEVALHDSVMLTRIPLLEWQRTGGRAATAGIALPGLDLGPEFGGRIDVRVVTTEPFTIRNNVLDGRLDVALAVRGTLANPALEGTVSGPDARILLPGIRLRATTMLVEWKRESPRFPVLTVAAQGRRHGFDVNVVVRGRYDSPEILLSSTPPLPPEELIVLITTGARPDSLRGSSGVGAVLGAYLAQELADWIFGSESTEAKESFVDRFTIETGTELSRGGTQSIVVEFRVLDSVYLRGERDVYEDLNMGVVYRLRFR